MQPLEKLFQQQASMRAEWQDGKGAEERDVFIAFDTTGGSYAVPVTCVREITDSYALTPYPEDVPGHLGIISLRGQVLPVVAPPSAKTTGLPASQLRDTKLLVLEFSAEALFCLPVFRVRKVLVARSEQKTNAVLNVQGRPVRIVTEVDLIGTSEVA